MSSILEKYGIKEVCDVTFYELDNNGQPTKPALYLDTLKVSTVEQTAEQADARGGKGNTILMSWDYNKEINVTLEDALFSVKSMALMFGGIPKAYGTQGATKKIMRTEQFIATGTTLPSVSGETWNDASGWKAKFEGPDGKLYAKVNPKFFDPNGENGLTAFVVGERYFCTFDLEVTGYAIEISANKFPGVYYVTGDTWARAEDDGKDEFFQLIFPKAKITSENTITMEAEGDPSVFSMNLKLLRPADGKMMKLVKYELAGGTDATESSIEIVHNHQLAVPSYAMSISGDTGSTATKSILGAASATSSDTAKATVAVSGGTVTVTSVAAGNAVIDVKNANSQSIAKIEVSVSITPAG